MANLWSYTGAISRTCPMRCLTSGPEVSLRCCPTDVYCRNEVSIYATAFDGTSWTTTLALSRFICLSRTFARASATTIDRSTVHSFAARRSKVPRLKSIFHSTKEAAKESPTLGSLFISTIKSQRQHLGEWLLRRDGMNYNYCDEWQSKLIPSMGCRILI